MERLEFFRLHATEFSNLPDEVVQAWFSSALVFINLSAIPASKQELAIAYYAAHLCWLNKYPGSGGASRGPILNEKNNKQEKQYGLIQNSDTWLGQSVYGQSFSALTKQGPGQPSASIITRFGTEDNGYFGC